MRVRVVRSSMRWDRLVIIAAVVVAAALGVSILAAPVGRLVVIVPDDAFYYLQIARNLVATGRSTADGVSVTNGYHPLWLAIVTSLAAIIPDREWLLRAAVGMSVLLHFVASWLVGARVTQMVGRAWGRAAALCWLLNRVAFVIALQAMESTLYIVMLLVALGVHLRLAATFAAATREIPQRRLLFLYGASLGFVILARTEGAIIAVIALVWLGARLWRTPIRWGLCAATLGLVVMPWLLFSLWQVGTIQQDSGAMKALWAADLFPSVASRLTNLLDTTDYFFRGSMRLMWYSLPSPLFVMAVITLGAACVAVQWRRPRGRAALALRAVVIPTSVVAVVYGLTLVDRQIWWLGLPWLAIFLTAMIGTVWLCRAIPAVRRRQPLVRGAVVAASLLSFIALARAPLAPYQWQADVLRSQTAIERLIPADQRIGCFNAGIPLYFGTGRVIALDGLVSHAARRYWIEHRVDDYVRDANVRFIADDAMTLSRARHFSRGPLSLDVRRTFPLRGWPTDERVLWAIPQPASDPASHGPKQLQQEALSLWEVQASQLLTPRLGAGFTAARR
jgi:hypothetical protein